MSLVEITLRYSGNLADGNTVDLYDVSQALVGFQRSLALTTHLILNNEIITQSPALKGAEILALPTRDGSWKLTAAVVLVGTGIYNLGTAPRDTPLGHLVSSAYDYVISETLGFHVDYEKSLGQQFEEMQSKTDLIKPLSQSRFESLIEKCEVAIRDMHRPIVKSKTAKEANISSRSEKKEIPLGVPLNNQTYEYIAYTERDSSLFQYSGEVSSYNINTYKGRVFVEEEGRPVPFELSEQARDRRSILAIASSLRANAERTGDSKILFNAYRNVSRTARTKSFIITEIINR